MLNCFYKKYCLNLSFYILNFYFVIWIEVLLNGWVFLIVILIFVFVSNNLNLKLYNGYFCKVFEWYYWF